MNMLSLPKKVYFKDGCTPVALRELSEIYHLKRAFLVSSSSLYRSGAVLQVDRWLRKEGIRTAECFTISSPPAFDEVRAALECLREFMPDVIIGIGGGAAMGAAKALWVLYETPELDLLEIVKHPERIRTGTKAKLVLVATSFGSGAQNSPFAVLKDDVGNVCVIHSSQLLPELSITDAQFTKSLPPKQIHDCGLAVLSRSVRIWSVCGEYAQCMAQEAIALVLENISAAEASCPAALGRLHNAGSLLGTACGSVIDTVVNSVLDNTEPGWEAVNADVLELLSRTLRFPDSEAFQNACRHC